VACGGRCVGQRRRPGPVAQEKRQPRRIRRRNRRGLVRESEGFIVPFEGAGQQNPARGKGPYFVCATEGRRMGGLPKC